MQASRQVGMEGGKYAGIKAGGQVGRLDRKTSRQVDRLAYCKAIMVIILSFLYTIKVKAKCFQVLVNHKIRI